MNNPHRYESGWTIEEHRDELIDRLGKAIRRINELEGDSGNKSYSMKIAIQRSPTADTRTCDYVNTSKETLLSSSVRHISDVCRAMEFFRVMLQEQAERHDLDKISDIDGFHHDFVTGFKQTEWWDNHRKVNRHHLLEPDGVPEDVNLIDVLDMIADCVMAGMARSGSVYPLNLPTEVLVRAFRNTVELLKSHVIVASGESNG